MRTVPECDPGRVPAEADARHEPLRHGALVVREEVRRQEVDQERHVLRRPRCASSSQSVAVSLPLVARDVLCIAYMSILQRISMSTVRDVHETVEHSRMTDVILLRLRVALPMPIRQPVHEPRPMVPLVLHPVPSRQLPISPKTEYLWHAQRSPRPDRPPSGPRAPPPGAHAHRRGSCARRARRPPPC